MKNKGYLLASLCGTAVLLSVFGRFVFRIDPYFQYRAPQETMAYEMEMNDFAYYNAGIAKNFTYDTILTGSSMSRAFLPSYIDEIFDCETVKLSMAEARGKDLFDMLSLAVKHPQLKRVIIGLDTFAYTAKPSYSAYEKPMYLYDDCVLNDVQYLANMDSVLKSTDVLLDTKEGKHTTTMDAYQNYVPTNTFSAQAVKDLYREHRPQSRSTTVDQQKLEQTIRRNLKKNLLPIIEQHPDITFLFYFPPYSIVKWGIMPNPEFEFQSMKFLAEQLMDYDNVSVCFYQGHTDVITDLDHYLDTIHFDSTVANAIVDEMAQPELALTKDNYEAIFAEFHTFIMNYPYDSLLEE